jgi:hypothetical protein
MALAGSAVGGVDQNMTIALKEMQEDSTLVNTLFTSEPPGIPYTIIAGNTSIIKPKGDKYQRKIEALVNRLGKFVVESPFMGLPNDIAVKVDSITHLPPRIPESQIIEVACDHLTYFSDPAGLAALAESVCQALHLSSYLPVVVNTEKSDIKMTFIDLIPPGQIESAQLENDNSSKNLLSSKKYQWSGALIGGIFSILVAISSFWFWQKYQNSQPNNPIKPSQSLNSSVID